MEDNIPSNTKIEIKTNIKKFYKQYLEVLRPLLNPHLSKTQLYVLAELLYYNYEYRNIREDLRGKLIFDYNTRVGIMESLDISYDVLCNMLHALKNKGYITGNKIKDNLIVLPGEEYSINYKFNIEHERAEA